MTPGFIPLISMILATAAVALALFCAMQLNSTRRQFSKQLQALSARLQTQTSGAIGMGQRILALEEKLHHLQESHNLVADANSASYTQAMQLFDHGADINTVMSHCGISSSEASLMALVREQIKPSAQRKKATEEA